MTQKIIIAGSRSIKNYDEVVYAIESAIDENFMEAEFEIISGGAYGVDTMAIEYAKKHNLRYRILKPVYLSKNDRSAPIRRNAEMAKLGDALIVVWDGKSSGTRNMIEQMEKLNKPVYKHFVV